MMTRRGAVTMLLKCCATAVATLKCGFVRIESSLIVTNEIPAMDVGVRLIVFIVFTYLPWYRYVSIDDYDRQDYY